MYSLRCSRAQAEGHLPAMDVSKSTDVHHDEIVAQEKGVGSDSPQDIDQGNEAVLLDITAAGKSGTNLKLAKDGHV